MDQSMTQRIRQRAYEIWATSGCPDGQAEQHWLAAERQIVDAPKIALATSSAAVKKSAAVRKVTKRS